MLDSVLMWFPETGDLALVHKLHMLSGKDLLGVLCISHRSAISIQSYMLLSLFPTLCTAQENPNAGIVKLCLKEIKVTALNCFSALQRAHSCLIAVTLIYKCKGISCECFALNMYIGIFTVDLLQEECCMYAYYISINTGYNIYSILECVVGTKMLYFGSL